MQYICGCGAPWNEDGVCLNHRYKGEKMIIGVAGKMGSGKDTVGSYLELNYNFVKMAFATDLKEMCRHVFKLSADQCYDDIEKNKPFTKKKKFFWLLSRQEEYTIKLTKSHVEKMCEWVRANGYTVNSEKHKAMDSYIGYTFETPRAVLQFVGTQILREIVDPGYHANNLFRKIKKHELQRVVICDARFPNERKMIKDYKGINLLVKGRGKSAGIGGHASENSLGTEKEYDYIVNNNSSYDDLFNNIDTLMLNIDPNEELWPGHKAGISAMAGDDYES
jgi:hypothetical protein